MVKTGFRYLVQALEADNQHSSTAQTDQKSALPFGNKLEEVSRGKKLMDSIRDLTSNSQLHESVLEALAKVGVNSRPEF